MTINPQDLDIRKVALDRALQAVDDQEIDYEESSDGDYADLVVETAAKFEKFLREGQGEAQ